MSTGSLPPASAQLDEGRAPRRIVLVIVLTLAALCVLYMSTLAVCILAGLTPDEKVLLQFVAGGTYVLGVLSGILVNPHSGSPSTAPLTQNPATPSPASNPPATSLIP